MDPLAEKYFSISPYAYCAGNPVNIVDPEGGDMQVFLLNLILQRVDDYIGLLWPCGAHCPVNARG